MSRRRRSISRQAPTLPPLAMLDLSKPGELKAHEFLLRATNPKDQMWTLLDVRRHGDVLLCVVRWVCPAKKMKQYGLVEVSVTEAAVRWRDFSSEKGARAELAWRLA